MDASIQKIELYGYALDTPQSKLDTNLVRQAFSTVASTWSLNVNAGFTICFPTWMASMKAATIWQMKSAARQ
ncbi:hypothetical protein ABH905_003014 [Pseudomonas frederiksbergensis]|uniref:hypothetical protein n=1 Tax=Pseudomonas frederiksbergensis TaxID=104087 RepID=UPI003D1AD0EB